MRIKRKKGSVVATVADVEVALLMTFLDELDDLIEVMAADDESTQRLFPSGYRDDETAAADFRELTQMSLQQERRDRYGQCRAELPLPAGEFVLTPDTCQRWLIVLNDMRLALGVRLGVSADGFEDLDAGDPEHAARAAYQWLTAIQDELLTQITK